MDLSSLSSYLTTLSGGSHKTASKISESARLARGLSLAQSVAQNIRSTGEYQYLTSVGRVVIDDFIEAKSDIILSLQSALINGDEDLIKVLQSDIKDLASIEADLELLETLDINRKFRENLRDLAIKSAKATIAIAGLV